MDQIGSNSLKDIENECLKEQQKAFGSQIIDLNSFATISNWIDNTKSTQFELLYRASEHSFSISSFHEICDNKGPTITIIETTKGDIFGGYNSTSWNGANGTRGYFGGNDKCFIFTLVNKNNIKPTMYKNNSNQRYVYNHNICGPSFGDDISIYQQDSSEDGTQDKGFESIIGEQSFPCDYSDTLDGNGEGKLTLTQSERFTIKDYEVFKVQ
ncbi:hypothetical protein CYY_003548 [Polysphondylium violaceum]|uniref:TLDc domain-containing protein n=1 Tax=Polysphondylium violaceum TaxID=133409 RepID=A0A8J4PW77_9MYCE|nr:hypothetical protein CYY_003548 [Polysphondylium violaceum]